MEGLFVSSEFSFDQSLLLKVIRDFFRGDPFVYEFSAFITEVGIGLPTDLFTTLDPKDCWTGDMLLV